MAIAILTSAAPAQFGTPRYGPGTRQPTGESLVNVEVIPSAWTIAPGTEIELAVAFRIEPQWHIYWRNAGASGMPTDVRVTAPDGFEVGTLRWPTPRSFRGEEGVTYGYEESVALFVPIKAPSALPDGPISLEIAVDWLVCKGICLTGSARRSVTINDPETTASSPAIYTRIVSISRLSLPRPLSTLDGATSRIDADRVIVVGPASAAVSRETMRFFPIESPGVTAGEPTFTLDGETFRVEIPIRVLPENSLGEALRIGGVIALADGVSYEFMLDAAPPAQPSSSS